MILSSGYNCEKRAEWCVCALEAERGLIQIHSGTNKPTGMCTFHKLVLLSQKVKIHGDHKCASSPVSAVKHAVTVWRPASWMRLERLGREKREMHLE